MEDQDQRITEGGFRHEMLVYAGTDDFLEQTIPFLREAIEAEELTLVVVSEDKIRSMRSALGGEDEEERVLFADMGEVGQNPARIIPAWREFVDEYGDTGRRLRGIGEPIWAGRSEAEIVECERHEALLDVAFAEAPGFWLICPYDVDALAPEVIEEAERNHRLVRRHGASRRSSAYRGVEAVAGPFDRPLPAPEGEPEVLVFDADSLGTVRALITQRGVESGLDWSRGADLSVAATELATNSIRHGGGGGTLRLWREQDSLVVEVHDDGYIDSPLVGRERPGPDANGGFGLWMVNQLCDLVQVRSSPEGSIVRLHMSLADGDEEVAI